MKKQILFLMTLIWTLNIFAAHTNQIFPLHEACSKGNTKEVEKLIKEGTSGCLEKDIDINEQDEDGDTALHLSIFYNYITIVELLLKAQANINICNNNGDTPLLEAVLTNNAIILKRLLDLQADFTIKDEHGNSPLHYAKQKNYLEIIRLLQEAGAKE